MLNSSIIQEHRLAGADRSSIFFLKVKGLSFSITKEGGCGGGMGVVVIWHGEWFGWNQPTNQPTDRTKQYVPHYYIHIRKNAPPTGGHVFLSNWNQFQTCPNIIGTNLLTKCHDDRTINMASRVLTGGHVFPPTRTIFELIQDIIRTNHLTKFHNNRKINVAYRVLTMKNAPPPDIIRTNLLTKFHEDKKINVASRVLTK
ncbi:hypothetical protein DPMN_149179 [Dreissena polymorpha]|uniref:Uncharacterized protein n=1 Tax=Dreissena polymorpha TaxID=45954 RepID=A0A9D4FAX2_DREPO|nr:hypothetical protein DPMN_149179 [Dreissena polymorpha]